MCNKSTYYFHFFFSIKLSDRYFYFFVGDFVKTSPLTLYQVNTRADHHVINACFFSSTPPCSIFVFYFRLFFIFQMYDNFIFWRHIFFLLRFSYNDFFLCNFLIPLLHLSLFLSLFHFFLLLLSLCFFFPFFFPFFSPFFFRPFFPFFSPFFFSFFLRFFSG